MILYVNKNVSFNKLKLMKYYDENKILNYVHPDRYNEINNILYQTVTFKKVLSIIKQYLKHNFCNTSKN